MQKLINSELIKFSLHTTMVLSGIVQPVIRNGLLLSGTRLNGSAKCPYCERRQISFSTLYPNFADELVSIEDNREADWVTPDSRYFANWRCRDCGKIWRSRICERVNDEVTCPHCEMKKVSLKALYPEIAKDLIETDNFNPEFAPPSASHIVSWECNDCHQVWSSSVRDKVNDEATCPYCDGRKAIPGVSSFAALYPDLMEEYYSLANVYKPDPDTISPKSQIAAFWNCKTCGHSFKMSFAQRALYKKRHKRACPNCKGYRRMKRYII